MKLKLKAFRKSWQNSVVLTIPGGSIKFSAVGDESPEIPDAIAHELLGKYPDMLEIVQDKPDPVVKKDPAPVILKKKAMAANNKMIKSPKNK